MLAMFSRIPSSSSSGFSVSLGEVEDLQRLLDSLQGEVLRLGREHRVGGGDERVDRQQPERRRAVDQDHVVAALDVAQGVAHRHLAADLAGEHQLGLGEPEVRRDHGAVDRRRRPARRRRAPRRASAAPRDRRRSSRRGCPGGRRRSRARRGRRARARRGASGRWSSCRSRPSGRAPRSSPTSGGPRIR